MTIDIPELDDKTFEELVERAKKRLPAYDDGWTDYNPSDPGIAILELMAYLTDTHTYQLDTVTDSHRQKYLQLVGERQEPPEAASVSLSVDAPASDGRTRIPSGTKLTVIDNADTDKIFETTDDLDLVDADIAKVITEHGEGRTDQTQANRQEGMFYRAFGTSAEESSALYLGFDGDPFSELDSLPLTVDFHDDNLPEPATHGDETPKFYPSVNVQWEYCTDYESPRQSDAWRPLSLQRDGTYAFYSGGRVTLTRPEGWDPAEWEIDEHGVVGQDPGLIWLRCRILEGGYEIPPQLDGITLNVVEAKHRSTVTDEQLTRQGSKRDPSTLSNQCFTFRHTPVLDATITVDGEEWEEVADFDASGPTDRHYVLDRKTGQVRFGDGVVGRMPEPDATVVATQYAFGGGREGNVPASATWRFLNSDRAIGDSLTLGEVSVSGESAGTGGTDGESLEEAFRRAKRDFRTPYRAVTEDDYRYVATHTPGLRFGRATVLVDERTDLGIEAEPAEVTVVVVPYAPLEQSRPEPTDGFLDAVRRHLDKYRLLTDRVTVEPPQYVRLSVGIEIQISEWLPESTVTQRIESTIEEYVHPVHGFEGEGWPFGSALYSDDLAELLETISFVDHVRDVSIQAQGSARVDGDGNVLIDESALLALDGVEVDIHTVTTDRE